MDKVKKSNNNRGIKTDMDEMKGKYNSRNKRDGCDNEQT